MTVVRRLGPLSSHGATRFQCRHRFLFRLPLIHPCSSRSPLSCSTLLVACSRARVCCGCTCSGSVFRLATRWGARVCPDGLVDHAAAPGHSSGGALGCVQPGGRCAAAAGAVFPADFVAWRGIGVGLVAVVGPVWPGAGGSVRADWPVDRLRGDVVGAGAFVVVRRDRQTVRAGAAALAQDHPAGGGIDLSPLVALVLLQVVMIVLGHVQASVMR